MRFDAERAGPVFVALCALNGGFVTPIARLTTERGAPLFVAATTSVFAGMAAAVVPTVEPSSR